MVQPASENARKLAALISDELKISIESANKSANSDKKSANKSADSNMESADSIDLLEKYPIKDSQMGLDLQNMFHN